MNWTSLCFDWGMRRWRLIAAALLTIPLVLVCLAFWRASRVRDISAREVATRAELPYRERVLNLAAPSGVEPISAAPGFHDIALLRDSALVSSAAGLYLYDAGGTPVRTWRPGLELPQAESGAMSAGPSEIFVATRGAGVLAFDGTRFRQILPDDVALRNVTAVLALSSGRVLFGTQHNGALAYDGHRLAPVAGGLKTAYVTALAGVEGDLWIGTLNQGVYRYHAGELDALASALPDPQVLSIAVAGPVAWVGTPLGVVEFRDGQRTRALVQGIFAKAVSANATAITVGTEDEGIFTVPLESRATRMVWQAAQHVSGSVEAIHEFEGERYAVTASSVYRFDADRGWREVMTAAAAALSARNVAALGFSSGALWVGYFDAGLDVLRPDFSRSAHYEDDALFCINRIVADASRNRTAVATANGLVLFDGAGRKRQVLGRKDGLLSDHVTDVAFREGGMVLATPAGLSFVDRGGVRSLYVFQGLVNNHVYSIGVAGDETVAGTLGGVSVLDKDAILANYTTANSGLRHNWVTAVARVEEDWFIGTYGAGVLRLGRDGRWSSFADLKRDFVVNPNAMLAGKGRVYAGSLGQGLFVYDRDSKRWTNVTDGLPSLNVSALAESGGSLYVGTDNGLVRMSEEALP
ncbi:MAG: hypothetical protein ABSF98_04145 [Bryobacteraceae bacterium]|jgi:ligand-binding sensor domain-containing protein